MREESIRQRIGGKRKGEEWIDSEYESESWEDEMRRKYKVGGRRREGKYRERLVLNLEYDESLISFPFSSFQPQTRTAREEEQNTYYVELWCNFDVQ